MTGTTLTPPVKIMAVSLILFTLYKIPFHFSHGELTAYTLIFAGLGSVILAFATLLCSFYFVPRLRRSAGSEPERRADWTLYCAYLIFILIAFICVQAIGGTLTDGTASMYKYFNTDLLFQISLIQSGLFIFWFAVKGWKAKNRLTAWLLFLPGVIPLAILALCIATMIANIYKITI